MDEAAVRGMALFKGKANCIACRNGPNFTDSGFYNIGLAHNPILDDETHLKVLKFDAKRTKNADWESITSEWTLSKLRSPTLRVPPGKQCRDRNAGSGCRRTSGRCRSHRPWSLR